MKKKIISFISVITLSLGLIGGFLGGYTSISHANTHIYENDFCYPQSAESDCDHTTHSINGGGTWTAQTTLNMQGNRSYTQFNWIDTYMKSLTAGEPYIIKGVYASSPATSGKLYLSDYYNVPMQQGNDFYISMDNNKYYYSSLGDTYVQISYISDTVAAAKGLAYRYDVHFKMMKP